MPVADQAIQACVLNRLDAPSSEQTQLAGVIGGAPSQYSKSPALWNAAFRLLHFDALYVPLDVETRRLGDLMAALRSSERVLGVNVTVPHKLHVIEYLDDLDETAARIQAVNTIARGPDGRLTGYNTDGVGFVESLLEPEPRRTGPFFESLEELDALLLGAGGSARAVAFQLAGLLGTGRLIVCNRTLAHAVSLVEELRGVGANASAIAEQDLPRYAPRAGIIINCTIKGQSGERALGDGRVVSTEGYSALAPADPVPLPGGAGTGGASSDRAALAAAKADIERNNQASEKLCAAIPAHVACYDLVYSPEETVFLRHARLTGHKTMNGKAMIIRQAALALFNHICRRRLEEAGSRQAETYGRIIEAMYRAW
jgi:shikimate dehydrogenase